LSLISAYQETTYRLLDYELPFSVRIGVLSPHADNFMSRHKLDQLFFITSENPSSNEWSEKWNLIFTDALMKEISKRGFVGWPARAEPDGQWPNEHGFFVSCSTQEAISLARFYEQNAIVMLPKGQAPLLVLCQKI
jgi:hypothetical protein